jgi:hypothetical protein
MGANTLPQPITITVTEYPAASAPVSQGALLVNFLPYAYLIDTQGVEPLPGMSVTITLPYDPASIPAGYTVADLRISYFDGTNWLSFVPVVDTVNDTVTMVTDHFSWWAVTVYKHTPTPMPSGNSPAVYPNPAMGSQVQVFAPGQTGNFDMRIQVYTVGSRKVQDLTVSNVKAGSPVTLDLLDKSGVRLSNGLYYLLVTTPQGHTTLKLLVLR